MLSLISPNFVLCSPRWKRMVQLRACPEVCTGHDNDGPEHSDTQDGQHLAEVGCSRQNDGCSNHDTHPHDHCTGEVDSFKRFAFEWRFAFEHRFLLSRRTCCTPLPLLECHTAITTTSRGQGASHKGVTVRRQAEPSPLGVSPVLRWEECERPKRKHRAHCAVSVTRPLRTVSIV